MSAKSLTPVTTAQAETATQTNLLRHSGVKSIKPSTQHSPEQSSRFQQNFSLVPVGATPLGIQPKLVVGRPHDRYEQEADRIAEQVMQMPDPIPGRRAKAIQSLSIQRLKSDSSKPLQWQADEEQDEAEEAIQAKTVSHTIPTLTATFASRLKASRGGGTPLPAATRAFMEARFSHDFSQVRVHTDETAHRLTRDLHAQAFTSEQDIYFGAGYYQPHTTTGKRLLAHELTHTIQQRSHPSSAIPPAESAVTDEPETRSQAASIAVPSDPIPQRKPPPTRLSRLKPKPLKLLEKLDDGTHTPEIPIQAKHLDRYPAQRGADLEARIQAMQGKGKPLPQTTRSFFEPRFGYDFGEVRVHTGTQANEMASQLHAHAFTSGQDIFFGSGQYDPQSHQGRRLLAHELAHTVQQGESHQFQPSDRTIQREGETSLLDDLLDFGEAAAWKMVRELAPDLEPILRKGPQGIFDWLTQLVTAGIEAVFDRLMAPVRAIAGVGGTLSSAFAPLLTTIQNAAEKIAANDCTPLRQAAEAIEQTARDLITPIIENLQPVVTKIKEFMSSLWDKIGAPIWGWIQEYAGEQWRRIQWLGEKIQAIATWIWDKTALFREAASQAWTWFKNKLGIGDTPEGQNGILQWVQGKIDEAWTTIKNKLEPFKQQITKIGLTVGGIVVMLSPAGPIIAIGAAVAGAVQGLRWIYTNWGKGNMIVQARTYLEKTLIPQLLNAAKGLSKAVTKMADSVISALSSFASDLTSAVGLLNNSLLRLAISLVQWIADKVQELADWATDKLQRLAQWIEGALDSLQNFLKKMLTFFGEVGKVVLDIWALPALLAKTIWNWIPACIRDPIVDFIVPIILRQIEIFQELVRDNEAWQRTKADVMNIVRLVFEDHDLMGAVKATFNLILRVFNIPPDLVITIVQKAANAWDVISEQPLEFIKNTVRSLGYGFRLLWENIDVHLQFGVEGWLFGELVEKNITPPASWTDPWAVFGFVLDVLGLSMNHIWDLLAKRFDEKKVRRIQAWFGQIAGVIAWINRAIDTSKTPAENTQGIIDQAKEFGLSILTGIAEWIAGKVAEELAILAAAAAASGGLSEVLDLVRRIYKAIVTAVRWTRRILEMANQTLDNVLQIASGAVEIAGALFERVMHSGMPVVIGFLADQVGLGGIGQALRDIVDTLREQVDKAILWLIDKIKAGIEALIAAVKAGAAAIMDWWKTSKTFQAEDGEDHTLLFKGSEENAILMVKSVERPFTAFVDSAEPGSNSRKIKAKAEAQRIAGLIDTEKNKPIIGTTPEEKDTARSEKTSKINALLEELKPHTSILFGSTIIDSADPEFGAVNSAGFGTSMSVKGLTNKNRAAGTPPTSASNETYDALNERKHSAGSSASYYIKGHLLNQELGGTGDWKNLTPLSRSGNAQHETQVESTIKRTVNLPSIVEYTVTPNYSRRSDKSTLLRKINTSSDPDDAKRLKAAIVEAEDFVPTSLSIKAAILNEELKQKKNILNQSLNNPIDRDYESYALSSTLKPTPVNLSTDRAAKIATLPGIGEILAQQFVEVRRKRLKKGLVRPFSSYQQISELVPGFGAARMEALENAGHVRLY